MQIVEDVKYIGVNDTTIDLFENQYPVPKGVSYNSYLILDESVAVLDTVDAVKQSEWEKNLLTALEGRSVNYLVIKHLEPDHAVSIGRLMELFPDMTLVGNAKTFQMLPQFFELPSERKTLTVKEGDTLCLGKHTLTFLMAPMVHWPEVMVSYDEKDKILFSADAFGTFGVPEGEPEADWAEEAARYYFNIVGKYGAMVQTLLKKVSGLAIRTICPLHGPVLKDNLAPYLHLYQIWSSYQPEKEGVLVAYASIHGNTAKAAKEAAELLEKQGVSTRICDLSRTDVSVAVALAFRYDKMLLAASSYNAEVFPCMQNFLLHLKHNGYQNRRVGMIENGSWAPSAGRVMKSLLETMKNIELVEPLVTIKSTMKKENEEPLAQLVEAL